jgi:hypothetical protein
MVAAPVQSDVDGISKGSHDVFLKRDNVMPLIGRGGAHATLDHK